ncbi:MAG: hypothetical protein M1817_000827 [Caeruleum heppii]|nr:MAG: hypothetical protein M1817_000827 [Caeruleum heppii]
MSRREFSARYEDDYYGPSPDRVRDRARDHAPSVRERDREYEEVEIRRRRDREPEFLREDYGRTDAGPLVIKERDLDGYSSRPRERSRDREIDINVSSSRPREREREKEYYVRPRVPDTEIDIISRSRERERVPEIVREDYRHPDHGPLVVRERETATYTRPRERERDRELEVDIISRPREREREISRTRERETEIDIVTRRERDRDRDRDLYAQPPPPRERERERTRETEIDIIRRQDDRERDRDTYARPRERPRERELDIDIDISSRAGDRDRERDTYTRPRERPRERNTEIDIDISSRAGDRSRSRSRDRDRNRYMRPRDRDVERTEIDITHNRSRDVSRHHERERERDRDRDYYTSPRSRSADTDIEIVTKSRDRDRDTRMEIDIKDNSDRTSERVVPRELPPLHQEIITHHRHIDHGIVHVPAPAPPSPPSPPPAPAPPPARRDRDYEEIEIRHREGPGYHEDEIILERDSKSRKARDDRMVRRRSLSEHRGPSRSDLDLDIASEAEYYNRRTGDRAVMGEGYNGVTRDWAIVDVPPGTERVIMDGVGGASQEVTWQRYNGVRRSKFVAENDIYDERDDSGAGMRQLAHRNGFEEMWTEITKDLVVREALEELGYDFEETEYFFYVIEYLRYGDILELVELSQDIRRDRRERIREIQWEREHVPAVTERRERRAIGPPPMAALPPSGPVVQEEDRYFEREVVYEGRRPGGRGYGY